MLTKKQNFLETIKKDGKPEYLPNSYTMFKEITGDPITKFTRGNRVRGTDSYDQWGTLISWPDYVPAAIPMVTPENQIIQDIEEWGKYLKVPDLVANCSDGWEDAKAIADSVDTDEYLSLFVMGTGIFEQLHMVMTFEDTLVNFLTNPDEMHEVIEQIFQYRLQFMKLVVENLHPDAIMSHDDWGTNTSLFMSPEVWREFFKEPYRRLYEYLHDNGVLVIHHSDSFCEPIVEDMAEIGIDVWQGAIPTNDIVKLTEILDGRMAIWGGIDSVIDREDVTEDEIRTETRRALVEYGELPHFIPGITYGKQGSLFPQVEEIVVDEICKWNKEHFPCEA